MIGRGSGRSALVERCLACEADAVGTVERCLACEADAVGTVERCLACEADAVGTMERCLACEAEAVGTMERCLACEADGEQGLERNRPIVSLRSWALRGIGHNIERWQNLGIHHDIPLLTTASQARQRSMVPTASALQARHAPRCRSPRPRKRGNAPGVATPKAASTTQWPWVRLRSVRS